MSDMTEFAATTQLDPCDASLTPVRLKLAGTVGAASCATHQLVTLIGGRRDCHLPISQPEVSKVHCALIQTGHGYLARDLCTRTGTFINGTRVRVAPLDPGDTLRVGSVEVAVELTALPPEALGTPPTAVAITLNGCPFDLAQTALVVGRRGTCDLVLDTPDVSLAHALIFAYRAQPVVFDLGSRSGTLVNGRRVHLAPLRNGDRLSIGGVNVTVECQPGAADLFAEGLTIVPAGDDAEPEAVSADPGPAASDTLSPSRFAPAVRADVAAARQQLERRALDLERRAAELDTLASLLAVESKRLERLKARHVPPETGPFTNVVHPYSLQAFPSGVAVPPAS
jgi:pSer/pThr/pTyr-binding forkhead associated (FHA) protein